jgi:DNA-binding NarL/FixJ family response regulator
MRAPRVLIVEGDLAEAQILEEAIFEIPERDQPEEFVSRRYWWNAQIIHAETLAAAISAVRECEADLVLLNPSLADQQGIDSFRLLKVHAPELPVILLLEDGIDEQIGRRALREGAQDYLFRSRCDWESLAHAMESALERSRLVKALWNSFLFDPMTGLPNRPGFVYIAGMLQTALNRLNKPLRMIVAALEEGASEEEIRRAADAIRNSVNDGDLAGRLGPSKFGILSPELDVQELSSRILHGQPAGYAVPRFRWSDWSQPAGSMEPMEKVIVGAEMLLTDSSKSASQPPTVQ